MRSLPKFPRSDLAGERDGTGLGLVIVKEVVEAHGGQVTVESKLETGTTFRSRFPEKPLCAKKITDWISRHHDARD